MIFRRCEYPLPKFPHNVAPIFKRLCVAVPVEKIAQIKSDLDNCMEQMRAEAPEKPNLDIKLADEIGKRCHFLLDRYSELEKKDQALVMGAVRYFVYDDDPFPDGTFATGLDDDATIVNHVLEKLGIEDQFIEIG